MATHSSILAWKTTPMEEPCKLQSVGSQRVRHDWVTEIKEVWHSFCKRSLDFSLVLEKTSADSKNYNTIMLFPELLWFLNYWPVLMMIIVSIQSLIPPFIQQVYVWCLTLCQAQGNALGVLQWTQRILLWSSGRNRQGKRKETSTWVPSDRLSDGTKHRA